MSALPEVASQLAAPITTDRLVLRPPALHDAASVASLMSPDVSRWLASWPPAVDPPYAEGRIAEALAEIASGRALHWLIESREGARTMGWVRVTRRDADRERGEFGFWLGEAFHGAGYAAEAARAALSAAFDRLRLAVIEGGAQLSNHDSVRVMHRVGMTRASERDVWAPTRQRLERCAFYEVRRPVALS